MRVSSEILSVCARLRPLIDLFAYRGHALNDEFDDLTARWRDTRSQRFRRVHLEPQLEVMHLGSVALQQSLASTTSAAQCAADAERQLQELTVTVSDAEAALQHTVSLLRSAEHFAARASSQARQIAGECGSLSSAVTLTSSDPGW
jgi:4-hydroxyphenylpyruvate dioxygenase-like putative hemolysin